MAMIDEERWSRTRVILEDLKQLTADIEAKRMMAKPNIYRKFTSDLDVVAIVSVGWICYKVITLESYIFDIHWKLLIKYINYLCLI
ncbi:hypothetical protein LXL04_016408 [Taraxacum kok-saghyz]